MACKVSKCKLETPSGEDRVRGTLYNSFEQLQVGKMGSGYLIVFNGKSFQQLQVGKMGSWYVIVFNGKSIQQLQVEEMGSWYLIVINGKFFQQLQVEEMKFMVVDCIES